MNYRADIQILRGISVVLVVLFHLGFSSIKSGFLGVDVFFVISGFLMAILYKNNDISGFYLRRAKRLLPAYYATIFFTLIFSYFLTTPNETAQVNEQALYAVPFLSNIGFWFQDSYFSNSHFNPLLHLWSLGVEIQFYLIVPLLYWFFTKLKINYWLTMILSLALCFIMVGFSPKTSFFLVPFRLWEFLIGYGAAHFLTNQGNVKYTKYKWLGLIGLIVVFIIPLLSVSGEARSAVNGHPGLYALFVSLATATVLAFGIPSLIERSYISKVLEKLGKYSYSIYLAHFPVIVIYLSKPFDGTNLTIPSLQDGITLFILVCIASALLYYFFEHKRSKYSIKNYALTASALLIGLVLVLPSVQNEFYSEKELLIFNASSDKGPFRCGVVTQKLEKFITSCDLTSDIEQSEENIMFVGNSHSDSVKEHFTELAIKNGTKLFIPISNTFLSKGTARPKVVVDDSIENKVSKIVIHSSPDSISNETINEVIKLSKSAGIKVYFIEPVPVWDKNIPTYMYKKMKGENQPTIQKTKEDYLSENADQIRFVRSINDDNFKSFPVVDYFCTSECRYVSKSGKPLYFDSHHLTTTGSYQLSDVFTKILKD